MAEGANGDPTGTAETQDQHHNQPIEPESHGDHEEREKQSLLEQEQKQQTESSCRGSNISMNRFSQLPHKPNATIKHN